MKRLYYIALILLASNGLWAQNNTDFWFAAPEVTAQHGDFPISLRLTSFSQTATVSITEPANTAANFPPINVTIPANSSVTVNLTTKKEQVECKPANTTLNFGLHIHSNVPITAYYEVSHTNNPEIFTLKGNNALGTSFYIPSQDTLFNHVPLSPQAYNTFDIIATEDATTVTITPKKAIVNHAAGTPFTWTLNKGQVYSAQATGTRGYQHLMGSTVTSNKPVAITVKDDSDEFTNPGQGCYDLTGDQIVPVNIIGQEYIVVRGFNNDVVDDWVFVTATVNNTLVKVNGTPVTTINAGATYSFRMHSNEYCKSVETSYPAYLYHVTGYGCETGSALLPPMDCTGSTQVAFTRTSIYSFEMILLTKAGAQGSFTLNGSPSPFITPAQFSSVPGNAAFVYARINFPIANLSATAHILANTMDIFHMGLIQTYNNNQDGCSYGYFSDFASLNLGPDQTVCPGIPVTFDAGPGRLSYAWTYNGTPVTPGGQTIIVTNPGIYSVTVNDHGCLLTDEVTLNNYPAPNPVISGVTSFCTGSSQALNVATSFSSYLWSTGATTQSVTVASSGTYGVTVTDNNGCDGTASAVVTVHPLPVVTLAQPSPACSNTPPFALTGGSPAGGDYTGTGVNSSGFFNPGIGVGTYLITYAVTDVNGCSAADSKTITVNEFTQAYLTAQPSVCISAPPFQLTGGTPAGGVYSGPGVSGTGIFDPSSGVGPHAIKYTVTNAEGCISSATKFLTVNPLPVVALLPQPSVCISDPPFQLTGGTPIPGNYSGTGVDFMTGIFTPSLAGTGIHTIIYTYTNSNGCTNSSSKLLTVYPLPNVQLTMPSQACITDPPFLLNGGTPGGGVYAGPGVTPSGFFDPAIGLGTYQISYTASSVYGCMNTAFSSITVTSLPNVQLSVPAAVCISDPPFELTGGTPSGGTYYIDGVMSGTYFDPASGPGPHTIMYDYANASGCSNSATGTITVNQLPVVQLAPLNSVCASAPPFALTGGAPAGGDYSGTGVDPLNFFIPATGQGTYLITYEITDINGCKNTASENLTVHPVPIVQLAPPAPVCDYTPPFPLTGGMPAGGSYQGIGVDPITNYFDPSSGTGEHFITYTTGNSFGCLGSDTKPLVVNPTPSVQLAAFTAVCITSPSFSLAGGSPTPGTYSGAGVTGNTGVFIPSVAGAGDHPITYLYTSPEGCVNSATGPLRVIPLPANSGNIEGPSQLCENSQNIRYDLLGNDPLATSFLWEINPTAAGSVAGTGNFSLLTLSQGFTGNLSLRFQPQSICGDGPFSPGMDVTIRANPEATLGMCNDQVTTRGAKPFLLKGGYPEGGTYSIDGTDLPDRMLNPATLSASPPDHTVTYTVKNSFSCYAARNSPLTVLPASVFTCKDILIDVRDNQPYPTFEVKTGTITRCWMSSNLNYGTAILDHLYQTDNCIVEKYCLDNDDLKCREFGGFYQWDELLTHLPPDNATVEGIQGLCPPEWHVATEAEWTELTAFYQGPALAGWNLTDTFMGYGFHARPNGIFYQNFKWAFDSPAFAAAIFWTSTVSPGNSTKIYSHGLNDISPSVSTYLSSRSNAFPVRCVKD